MLRLLGGGMILAGGILLRGTILSASRRELQTQCELRDALMLLEKEIKFTLTPMPKLLMSENFGASVSEFFAAICNDLQREKTLAQSWSTHAQDLALPQRIKGRFARLGRSLSGDEDSVRQALALMAETLSESIETQERTQRDRERLTTMLCISASIMLVLVLI